MKDGEGGYRPDMGHDSQEVVEVGFDEGVSQIVGKLNNVLQEKDTAFLVIISPLRNMTNVGKTRLVRSLTEALAVQGIAFSASKNPGEFSHGKRQADMARASVGAKKIVFALEQGVSLTAGSPDDATATQRQDINDKSWLREAQEVGFDIDEIDVRAYIHRPDKLFEKGEIYKPDVIINNTEAVDKNGS